MYGFTKGEEMVGRRLTEMLVAADPRNMELTREYIRSGFRVMERESHEIDLHGQPKVFRNSMIGIVENGKLACTWGIQRDVTEQTRLAEARGQAENALQLSEAHFRLLVEQASDGIFIADEQGRYIDVNSSGAGMLGYTREEILQLSLKDIVASDEAPRLPSEVGRFEGGATVLSEWQFRRKDGSVFPGEVCGKRLPDGRLQGILRDVSERRRAEDAMRQSEERFRVALKDSPITVFSQDCELRYTWIYNPQLYWQHGCIGKTDAEIIGPKKAANLMGLKRRVLKKGTALREEVLVADDGKSYPLDITIEPLFDEDGRVIGITGAAMDIARLREIADRLQDAKDKLAQEKSYLESEIQTELGFEEIIGQSSSLREVLKNVRVVAPTDSTVLLLGETGTGKELVARSVHSLSARRDKTFVKLNCAAVPSGLLESELFGHEKGAFTSAVSQKAGRIELADKGTLFLDEIGELPLELQPKLLRVLQDREFERLGGVHTLHVDVRIIAATNRDLRQDIADKKFREDLYYRLNVFPVELPSLRERRSDVPILIHHFVRKHSAKMGKHVDIIPDETMTVLQGWHWPGNIRELENMIERMVILSKGRVLAAPPVELGVQQEVTEDNLREMKREHLIRVLRETGGILSGTDGAASRLGIKRTTLQSMLKRHGIELQNFRRGNGMSGQR
jgi:PAS domain S-box-containing protein